MKLKDIFVVEIFIPTEICCSTLIGTSDLKICKKVEINNYVDLDTKKIYNSSNNGYEKILQIIPWAEYFYRIGLKKSNEHQNRGEVYRLAKRYQIKKLI